LDFLQTAELKLEDDSALAAGSRPLRFVPRPLAHQPPGEGIKGDSHAVFPARGKHSEALAQNGRNGEILRPPKCAITHAHGPHSRQRKRSNLPARGVEGEEVPLVVDRGEMIRLDAAFLVGGAAQLTVLESNLARP